MSADFQIIPFQQMFSMMLSQLDQGHFMGIPQSVFAKATDSVLSSKRFGQSLGTPVGVAAGPHSQLSQNIVAAWLCGARYIELKTVQTLDELNVSKPCIDMQDEGYNCEWSQELKIHQSFEQYLDAWIMIHVLQHKLGFGNSSGANTIFNMSVGYNLEGILKENVQWFFSKMENCASELNQKIDSIRHLYPEIDHVIIPDRISDNITLSTMHGCPPDEIEKIGLYLIHEKKLHTTIKLNPTLLGPEKLRGILNDTLGFKTQVPDDAFAHDLKYADALAIIRNLQVAAKEENVFFGLKLTNTLESMNIRGVFPENEKMNYMSGRALHAISVHVAAKLQNEFEGSLDISFSAGADAFNIADILHCGMSPVTMSSDLLKPGGYGRISQYLKKIEEAIQKWGQKDLLAFMGDTGAERVERLNVYATTTLVNPDYKKAIREPNIKTAKKLGFFDCIHAPCQNTCPTNQDIPAYMHYVAQGNFQQAFEVIMRSNALPNITGTVCDHDCQSKCTRINYDETLAIREVKRWVAALENDESFIQSLPKNGLSAVIVGAGPAGLSCAYFLLLSGFDVEVYEEKSFAGGMVADVIPSFRLKNEAIQKDIDRIIKLGAKIHFGHKIDSALFDSICQSGKYVFIATGAPETKKLGIVGDDSKGVIDPLVFLSQLKKGYAPLPGNKVLVIGGGNTAMDVARAAKKLLGADGSVSIVYRRKSFDMPAETEEILAAVAEGINIVELTAPERVQVENGKVIGLNAVKMKAVGVDSTGRSKVEAIKDTAFVIEADVIFPAIGQNAILDFIDPNLLLKDSTTYETKMEGVYIGGDVRKGAANIISAIADGRKAARAILEFAGKQHQELFPTKSRHADTKELMHRKARRVKSVLKEEHKGLASKIIQTEQEAMTEAERCLLCDEICNICVTVCPNLANQAYECSPLKLVIQRADKDQDGIHFSNDGQFEIKQNHQTYNIGEFCNECGNCNTFCPTAGAPYLDKPKVYLTKEAYADATNAFYLYSENDKRIILHKSEKGESSLTRTSNTFVFENAQVQAEFNENFELTNVLFKDYDLYTFSFDEAVQMRALLEIGK